MKKKKLDSGVAPSKSELTFPFHQKYRLVLRGFSPQSEGISSKVVLREEKSPLSLSGHTLYNDPSAPTEHPSSKLLVLLTRAAMPHADRRAARLPIRRAKARKNWRSGSVVSIAKKCENIPIHIKSSSVGSLIYVDVRYILVYVV